MPEYRQLTRKNAHAYVVAGNRVARTRLWKPVCHYLFQKGPGEVCSTTLTLQTATMATKPLTQVACCDICQPSDEKDQAEFHPLHMNWATVTDTDGNRVPQMCWRAN